MHRFVRETLGTVAVMAAFVALGATAFVLGGGISAEPAEAIQPAYPRGLMNSATGSTPTQPSAEEPTAWLVDGFNLLHAAVLRGRDRKDWWGAEARGRVVELVRGLDAPGAEVIVVFDGRRPADEPEEGEERVPRVVFALSADDWLLAAVRRAPDPTRVVVVTADRQLADRARHRGARVLGPTAFRARCGGSA
jgi:predicted RNA-binding protein with PIN domain